MEFLPTSDKVTEFLNVSKPTELRTITELKALGLVYMKEDSISHGHISK